MVTQLKKIGNSKGIVIPSHILKALGIKERDLLNLSYEDDCLIVSKQEEFNPKSLEELFIDYVESERTEIIFNDAQGREIW